MVDLSAASWRKSRRSNSTGECVEVARLRGAVAVRDSKDPGGAVLVVSHPAWRGFVTELKHGFAPGRRHRSE